MADSRSALIQAARRLFGDVGYASVGTEDIVRAAGVTRGSMYHHFRDKADLFAAVLERVEDDLARDIEARRPDSEDPFDRLTAGLDAFLHTCQDPAFRRIALLDAPAVLGWRRLRELDDRFGLGYLKHVLADAMDKGAIDRVPVEPLAHLLLGAALEGGLLVGRSRDREQAQWALDIAMQRLLEGLRPSGAGGPAGPSPPGSAPP
jgi:AcrR family transcriptional regulator